MNDVDLVVLVFEIFLMVQCDNLTRLLFPANYPHAPPTMVMVTPSGRLETGCRLCCSLS